MRTLTQAIFYVVMLFWIVALVKMIMIYIQWDAKTIFTAGCVLMTFGFIPSMLFSYWKKGVKKFTLILVISVILSILAYLSGTLTGIAPIFPNFWIGILIQALALGILSLITTERKTIMVIWIVWLTFSIVLMTIHLLGGTL